MALGVGEGPEMGPDASGGCLDLQAPWGTQMSHGEEVGGEVGGHGGDHPHGHPSFRLQVGCTGGPSPTPLGPLPGDLAVRPKTPAGAVLEGAPGLPNAWPWKAP